MVASTREQLPHQITRRTTRRSLEQIPQRYVPPRSKGIPRHVPLLRKAATERPSTAHEEAQNVSRRKLQRSHPLYKRPQNVSTNDSSHRTTAPTERLKRTTLANKRGINQELRAYIRAKSPTESNPIEVIKLRATKPKPNHHASHPVHTETPLPEVGKGTEEDPRTTLEATNSLPKAKQEKGQVGL